MHAVATLHRGDCAADRQRAACRHASCPTRLPRASRARARVPDTDWHVESCTRSRATRASTLMPATHSRYVVDLNRDPSGAALYRAPTTPSCVPRARSPTTPIYARDGRTPDGHRGRRARRDFFHPYHEALAAEIERVRERHGYAILLDGHSIRAEVPRFFAGRLPDLNLGTADGASCARRCRRSAAAIVGGDAAVHARRQRPLQGRLDHAPLRPAGARRARAAARDGAGALHGRGAAVAWDAARAAPLAALLERLVVALAEWRPR